MGRFPGAGGWLAVASWALLTTGCHQHDRVDDEPVRLEVHTGASAIALGTAADLFAIAIYSNATKRDVTGVVDWHAANESIAGLSADGDRRRVTGLGVGSTTIVARWPGSDTAADFPFTVTAAILQSIAITPSTPAIALGTSQQLVAIGTFSDSTVQDLTNQLLWESSQPSVAAVATPPGNGGRTTATGLGTATITARDAGSGVTGHAELTVTAATLTALAVTPTAPSVPLGVAQQFTATGTFSDSTVQDVTAEVTWSSTSTGTASVSNGSGTEGLAATHAIGSTTITATHLATSLAADTTLTVTAAVLVGVAVTPDSPAIALGTARQFTATGTYSDSSIIDLTAVVTWASSQPAVATISNAPSTAGLADSAATGVTTISATHAGSGLLDSTTLTVNPAVLVTLAITPVEPEVLQGASRPLTATGTFSDSTQQDLTDQVTWSSGNPAAVTVSNVVGSEGVVSGIAAGASTVTATDPGTGVLATTTVTTLADITLRGATTAGADNPAALTLAVPAGTEADDLLVAAIAIRPATASITPPAGWVLVRRIDNSSSIANSLAIYRRRATAAEPADYPWSVSANSGVAGTMSAWIGVDPDTPLDAETGQNTASGTAHAAPSVTTATPDTTLLTFHNFASASLWTVDGSMTEVAQASSIPIENSVGISLCGAFEHRLTVGASGTRTATTAGHADAGNTASLALRPWP
ncbi:MAG: Ig-like domain-containing protein [bacterium]|nr:Ig-like domain-containing protein [bacterium]